MITFETVTKTYPDGTVAVDDLSLEVPTGTLTVFVGPSGCGKTTSMRMINRMIEPSSGTLTVDGRDVATVNPVKLRLGIGYVIQSGGLMPHQRVIDNVATVPVLKGESRRAARKAAYEVLERVGLDPKLGDRYPAQLSGGQQQRVGVARALAADPPVLLMDEPFSAVDPVVRDELQAEILRLQGELHKTIVFVTHDIDEAIKLGDRVAVFGPGGTLQQYDAPARLLSNPANEFVVGFHRRRPRLPRPAVPAGDRRCRCTTFGRSTRREIDALSLGARRLAAGDQATTAGRTRGSTPTASSCTGTEVRCTTAPSPADRCSHRTARCGWHSMRRCPRRPGSGSPSTTTVR